MTDGNSPAIIPGSKPVLTAWLRSSSAENVFKYMLRMNEITKKIDSSVPGTAQGPNGRESKRQKSAKVKSTQVVKKIKIVEPSEMTMSVLLGV